MLAFGAFQNELEPLAHRAGGHGAVLLHWRGEHPPGVHRFSILLQHRHHRARQRQLADGGVGFRCAELQLALHIVNLLVHTQYAGLEVQVVPLERHQLASAQAGSQVQKEQLIVALRLGLNEKPLELLPVQHLHLPRLLGRQLAADGGVGADQPLLHGLFQRGAAGGVTHAHHPIGQPLAVQVGKTLSPRFFQPCVELL